MSNSPAMPSAGPSRPVSARWLLLLAGFAFVGPLVGWGIFSAFHQQVDAVNEAESEDEIAFLDTPGELPEDEPGRPVSGTLTDVVSAVHQESPENQSTVTQVNGQRPASNPSAWLSGTIEDAGLEVPDAIAEPAAKVPNRYSRFSSR